MVVVAIQRVQPCSVVCSRVGLVIRRCLTWQPLRDCCYDRILESRKTLKCKKRIGVNISTTNLVDGVWQFHVWSSGSWTVTCGSGSWAGTCRCFPYWGCCVGVWLPSWRDRRGCCCGECWATGSSSIEKL